MALLHMDANVSDGVISSKEIAEIYELPVDLLGKVMQALARSGLVEAEHGAKGGYRLKCPLERISLGSVIEAIEGRTRLVKCQSDVDECLHQSACIVKEPLHELHMQLRDFMHGITLDQLRRQNKMHAVTSGI